MSRKLLILSTVLLLVGVAILVYADPLARLSLGGAPGRITFNNSITRTFTFGNSTVTVPPGSGTFPGGGFVGRVGDTNGQLETLVALAILAVGIVLEVVTVLLWQSKPKPPQAAPT
jgi:hypothetical protein